MHGNSVKNHRFALLDIDPRKGLVSLAIPMIIAFLFQTGFNIVDTIFVGRLGPEAIAGVSLAFPFQMFIIALSSGFGVGAQSLIARSIGSNKKTDADKAAGHAILIAMLAGLVTTSVGLMLAPTLVSSMDASVTVSDLCLEYLMPILLGSVFIYLNMMSNSILRGEGDTKKPMYFMAIGAVLNIILDPLFIFYFDFGVSGAAYATILSRLMVNIIIFYYLFHIKGTYTSINKRSMRPNLGIIKGIVDVGLPASLAQIALSLSLFFLNDLVSPFGQNALAAFGVGFRVESVVFLPMIGLSSAFVSAVGYFKGSGQHDKIRLINNYALKLLISFMVVCSLIFFNLPEIIISIFINEEAVISIGKSYLRILSVFYPLLPFSLLSAAGFQGIGKGYPSLVLAFLRSGCISVPLAYIFTVYMGRPVSYIWLSIAIGDTLSAIYGYLWFNVEIKRLGRKVADQ